MCANTSLCVFQLPGLHHRISNIAVEELYVAPEVLSGNYNTSPFSGGRTLVLTDSLSKFKADSISKNGFFIYS